MSKGALLDVVVVGAGIAGLATAEIFARSGRSVMLLERNDHVCSESSGSHHEWFHFGSLYAIFPSNTFMRTLVGGIDDLLAYYSAFSGMNLRVGPAGELDIVDVPGKWIRDTPIEYVVTARNDPDFSLSKFTGILDYSKKVFFLLTWEAAIKQFISRHQRFHRFNWSSGQASEWVPRNGWWNYSRDVIHRVRELDAALDPHTHFMVPGFDRPMESGTIIADLLRSYLHHGGQLKTGTVVERIEPETDKPGFVVTGGGEVIAAKEIILAGGRSIGDFVDEVTEPVKVVLSPLLVVYPAVSQRNFVRLTPFPKKTVNHLCHWAAGEPYSLIGGGYYADVGDERGLQRARDELLAMAKQVFPQIAQRELVCIYESHKVELPGRGTERNYQYHVKMVGQHVHMIVPGKFSLAFSLALKAFRMITGEEPPIATPVPALDVSLFTGQVRHKKLVLDHLSQRAEGLRA